MKKLREKLIREKTLKLKTTLDLVTQVSHERRHERSTIPTALVKEDEMKKESIQKKNTKQTKTKTKKHQHCDDNTKHLTLRVLRTTKLGTTTQMPGKNGGM